MKRTRRDSRIASRPCRPSTPWYSLFGGAQFIGAHPSCQLETQHASVLTNLKLAHSTLRSILGLVHATAHILARHVSHDPFADDFAALVAAARRHRGLAATAAPPNQAMTSSVMSTSGYSGNGDELLMEAEATLEVARDDATQRAVRMIRDAQGTVFCDLLNCEFEY